MVGNPDHRLSSYCTSPHINPLKTKKLTVVIGRAPVLCTPFAPYTTVQRKAFKFSNSIPMPLANRTEKLPTPGYPMGDPDDCEYFQNQPTAGKAKRVLSDNRQIA
jgi:hypothetical protein